MKYAESVVCWNDPDDPGKTGDIAVWPLGSGEIRERGYKYTDGGIWVKVRQLTSRDRLIHLLNLFIILTVDYRLDPGSVHRAFFCIDEYRYSEIACQALLPDDYRRAVDLASRGEDPSRLNFTVL